MKVLKGDLYAFIEKKVATEKSKIRKDLLKLELEYVRNPISKAIAAEFDPIIKLVEELYVKYEDFVIKHDDHRPEFYNPNLNTLNNITSKSKWIVTRRVEDVLDYISSSRGNPDKLLLNSEELQIAKDKIAPNLKKLDDLETLLDEVNAVIKASTSGKKAYNALVALGIDMSDLESAGPMLPAVQKLSVEPCLINGGC